MTFHRALGFVDRSVLADDSPLRVVMASEGRMADKIDLRMSGADLSRFRGNPVLGYGHSYWGRTNLPIGRVDPESIAIADRQLSGEILFDSGDPFAVEIERKMRAGFLNAVSIGFEVTQWESAEDSYWRGGVATKWELSELSVVPVPMDASALVTSGRGLVDDADRAFMRALIAEFGAERLALALADGALTAPPDPHPDPVAPPAAGVPTDTARGLLDAFTITKESHA